MKKRIPTTQFKNKSAAQWLKGWEFYTTRANTVDVYNEGYFLSLDSSKNLVIFDVDGVHACLKLSSALKYKMQQIEETLQHMQLDLNDARYGR